MKTFTIKTPFDELIIYRYRMEFLRCLEKEKTEKLVCQCEWTYADNVIILVKRIKLIICLIIFDLKKNGTTQNCFFLKNVRLRTTFIVL